MNILDDLFINIGQWWTNLLSETLSLQDGVVTVINGLIGGLILALLGVVMVLALTYMERKVFSRLQDRIGPNRWGPLGIFQAVCDAIKMLTKEDIVPDKADKLLFNLAPILMVIPAVLLYAALPFGRGMVGSNLSVGVLYVVGIGSLTGIAVMTAGWSSNNKYGLLGAFRVVAQLVSYEIPMVLSMASVVLLTGSMSLVDIVEKQTIPNFVLMPVAFFIYTTAAMAELGRSPFDLLEADSEIVAGYFIEYSGMKFALFFLAEYINLFAVAGLITTMFLGGWQWPILPGWLWFFIKTFVVIFFFIWMRGSWPRFRIDHMLNFAWKFLVPLALANIMVVALVDKLLQDTGEAVRAAALLSSNILLIIITLAVVAWAGRRSRNVKLEAIVGAR
ncbi:MAG: NADH-quinone oxidoreductase subunit H [Anaerolineaceae bacterium 4572_32.2]|nr:MAG: NADH-quinone oxidoreductase subunit H [Anaerolineaceae bacterium 4572_32.2]